MKRNLIILFGPKLKELADLTHECHSCRKAFVAGSWAADRELGDGSEEHPPCPPSKGGEEVSISHMSHISCVRQKVMGHDRASAGATFGRGWLRSRWAVLLAFLFTFLHLACDKKEEPVREVPLTLVSSWAAADSGEGMIGYPSDFIVSSKGEIVMTDVRLNQLLFFEPSGEIIRRIGRPGQRPLEFAIPDNIAQVGDSLVVWDYENNRLQILTLEGEFIASSVPEPRIDFNSKAFDRHGNLYYATGGFRADSMVYVYNAYGEFIMTFGQLEAAKFDNYDPTELRRKIKNRELPAALKNSVLLCTTSDDGVFISHTALTLIKKYARNGKKLFEKQIAEPYFDDFRTAYFAASDTLPDFAFKPLRFWADATPDGQGGVFLLLNSTLQMVVFHFNDSGKLVARYFGPDENIAQIFFDGRHLWAVGRRDIVFYRFSLDGTTTQYTDE